MKRWVRLTLALGLSLITGLLSKSYITELELSKVASAVPVVTLKEGFIENRRRVSSELVEVQEIPEKMLPENAIVNPDDIIGKIVNGPASRGEILTKTRIVSDPDIEKPDEPVVITKGLQMGMRALPVYVNHGMDAVKNGDRVDVLAVDNRGSECATIVEDVEILQVPEEDDYSYSSGSSSVTLAVSPKEAEVITAWEKSGVLKLARRVNGDHEKRINKNSYSLPTTVSENQITPNRKAEDLIETVRVEAIRGVTANILEFSDE